MSRATSALGKRTPCRLSGPAGELVHGLCILSQLLLKTCSTSFRRKQGQVLVVVGHERGRAQGSARHREARTCPPAPSGGPLLSTPPLPSFGISVASEPDRLLKSCSVFDL